ncbi:entericidin A/B family lipoprotein [Arenibaculum sp.]|jgi:predicted small secreted protein|nr:entericidin A/B family lipoprotein [Arenibaculum sp.]
MLSNEATRLLAVALLGSTFFLGACNTMEGLGQDMQAGGESLEEEAEEAE